MDSFSKDLLAQTTCELRVDAISKRAYSVDASIYEIEPLAIVIPRTQSDLVTAVKLAYQYRLPIIPRGAATGITGGCLGRGVIFDLSKYLNHILEINYDEKYAIVEPGVIQDQLNHALAANGYRLGPDTSTGNRATLGGMVANNSAGARSLRYGKMIDHVQAVDLLLATGELLDFSAVDAATWETKCQQQDTEGRIYKALSHIRSQCSEEIARRFPKIPRRVSGYNLDELIKPGPFNVCKLIVGSEGTLGVATKIKVDITKKPLWTALTVIPFQEMLQAMHSLPALIPLQPMALEMIDAQIIASARRAPSLRGKLEWLKGDPEAVIIAEFEGTTTQEALAKAKECEQAMISQRLGYAHRILSDPEEMLNLWAVRKQGLGLLLSRRTYSRAIAFIEDLSIAPQQLAPFMEKFLSYLKKIGKQAGIYGHVGSGCMHIRPYIDLREESEVKLMHRIMEDVSDLVLEFGGALTGEHGDGLIRSWLNKKMFGDTLYQAFVDVKSAFDPAHLMNPGKIVQGPPLENDLRLSPGTTIRRIDTFLDFGNEGGIELAADLCNGNGQCRKKEGVMCPSFQASGDEYHTTRARAQALRGVINSRMPLDTWTSHAMHDVLDLCIECKGCKNECPSQVDMAKMKAEFLYQYQEKHGYTLRSRLFAHLGTLFHVASPFARLFNRLGASGMVKRVLGWIGIAPERSLPPLASQRFSQWLKLRSPTSQHQKQVILFNDTYTEFVDPHIGIAAVKILEALGYEVIVPPWECCGRPMFSKGLLAQAKMQAMRLAETLSKYSQQGLTVIALEPSCLSMLTDDFKGLLENTPIPPSLSLDEFLLQHIQEGKLPLPWKEQPRQVKLHGHCHQKSLRGTKPALEILKAIPGCHVEEIETGCCGMAGSFGYEKEHYAFSLKIGELKLFPAVRQATEETIIVADGISCRSHILHATGRQTKHLAEFLADALS